MMGGTNCCILLIQRHSTLGMMVLYSIPLTDHTDAASVSVIIANPEYPLYLWTCLFLWGSQSSEQLCGFHFIPKAAGCMPTFLPDIPERFFFLFFSFLFLRTQINQITASLFTLYSCSHRLRCECTRCYYERIRNGDGFTMNKSLFLLIIEKLVVLWNRSYEREKLSPHDFWVGPYRQTVAY